MKNKPNKFRGREIFEDHGYPAVMWGDHPICTDGRKHVRIHRIIAYEKFNGIPKGLVVHHKDGDKWNWDPDNIDLVSPSEHARKHYNNGDFPQLEEQQHAQIELIIRKCKNCGGDVVVKGRGRKKQDKVYCDRKCVSQDQPTKINWPNCKDLRKLVRQTNFSEAGRRLGVSDNAIRKRIKNHCRGT